MKHWRLVANRIAIAGAMMFIIVLFLSAYWERDIRWLYFFQSWIYLAVMVLLWKQSKWGYYVGFGAALFWNYTTLFVNTFLRSGLEQTQILMHPGQLPRPDLFVSVPGWIGNLLVLFGCIVGYLLTSEKKWTDPLRLLTGMVATTAFFALIVALFQPRYLPLFRGALHPHL